MSPRQMGREVVSADRRPGWTFRGTSELALLLRGVLPALLPQWPRPYEWHLSRPTIMSTAQREAEFVFVVAAGGFVMLGVTKVVRCDQQRKT